MSWRVQRRINLGNGVGLNVSKTGISPSLRTRYGAIGPKGFSIRTGIPGLSFRKYRSKSKKNNDIATIMAVIFLIISLSVFFYLVVWNTLRFIKWGSTEIYHFFERKRLEKKIREEELAENTQQTI
jgi:hypothetical protein